LEGRQYGQWQLGFYSDSRRTGASNPTYTIFALSKRGAKNLSANWSTVAG
jgi:hypothetical protein